MAHAEIQMPLYINYCLCLVPNPTEIEGLSINYMRQTNPLNTHDV